MILWRLRFKTTWNASGDTGHLEQARDQGNESDYARYSEESARTQRASGHPCTGGRAGIRHRNPTRQQGCSGTPRQVQQQPHGYQFIAAGENYDELPLQQFRLGVQHLQQSAAEPFFVPSLPFQPPHTKISPDRHIRHSHETRRGTQRISSVLQEIGCNIGIYLDLCRHAHLDFKTFKGLHGLSHFHFRSQLIQEMHCFYR